MIFDDYGQPDYEAMILARQEAEEISGDCDSDCEHCPGCIRDYCLNRYLEEDNYED